MVGQFRNIESVFEVQHSVNEFPVSFGGLGNPGFSFFVIYGSESLGYYGVR